VIQDGLTGYTVYGAGSACEWNCPSGAASDWMVQDFYEGGAEAMINELIATFRLAMEPVTYLHLMVPRYATAPARQLPSWLSDGPFTLGPYTYYPAQDYAGTPHPAAIGGTNRTDHSADGGTHPTGPYTYAADPDGLPVGASIGQNGVQGFGMQMVYGCGQTGLFTPQVSYGSLTTDVLPPALPGHRTYLNGMGVVIGSTSMRMIGAGVNDIIGVSVESVSYYVSNEDLSNSNITQEAVKSNATIKPWANDHKYVNSLSESKTVNLTMGPLFAMTSFGQIGGVYPLVNQNLDLNNDQYTLGVAMIGVQASFTYVDAAFKKYGCLPLPNASQATIFSDWNWSAHQKWSAQLLRAFNFTASQQYVNVNRTLLALYQNGVSSVFATIVTNSGLLINSSFVNGTLYQEADICHMGASPLSKFNQMLSNASVSTTMYLQNPSGVPSLTSELLLQGAITQALGSLQFMNSSALLRTQLLPWMAPMGQLLLTLQREYYEFFNGNVTAADLTASLNSIEAMLSSAYDEWVAWRLPLVSARTKVNETNWSVSDSFSGLTVNGTSPSAESYANGTLLAMRNELVAFMRASIATGSYLGVIISQPPSLPSSPVVLGPYTLSPTGELVGLLEVPNGTTVSDFPKAKSFALSSVNYLSGLAALQFGYSNGNLGNSLSSNLTLEESGLTFGQALAFGGAFVANVTRTNQTNAMNGFASLNAIVITTDKQTYSTSNSSQVSFNATVGLLFYAGAIVQSGFVLPVGQVAAISISFFPQMTAVAPRPQLAQHCLSEIGSLCALGGSRCCEPLTCLRHAKSSICSTDPFTIIEEYRCALRNRT
jgi:hypothetical protein